MQTNIKLILKDLDVVHGLIHHHSKHIVFYDTTYTSIHTYKVNEIGHTWEIQDLTSIFEDMANGHGEPTTNYKLLAQNQTSRKQTEA